MNGTSARKVKIEADDEGVVAYAGLHALATLADGLALGDTLSTAIPWTGERAPLHDRGKVLVHAMLMLAGGGDSCSDIEVLRTRARLFGAVPSDSTLYRTLRDLKPAVVADVQAAFGAVRGRVWGSGRSHRRAGAGGVGHRRVARGDPFREQGGHRPDL